MKWYEPEKHGRVVIPALMPLQEKHAQYLSEVGFGADFSEPGAAKTLTALQAVRLGGNDKLIVVTSPISIRMWVRTAAAFMGTDKVAVLTPGLPNPQDADVLVVTYNTVGNEWVQQKLAAFVAAHKFCAVICDEAHALKSVVSKRTIAVYGANCDQEGVFTSGANAIFALTGSPIRRHNDDVYPHLRALAPDILSAHGVLELDDFKRCFCRSQLKTYHPRMRPVLTTVGSRNTELLGKMLYEGEDPFAVRRKVSDLGAMPPLIMHDISVGYEKDPELEELTAKLQYEDFEQETPAIGTIRRLLGRAKAPHVAGYAGRLNGGIVLFWHRETGAAIADYLTAEEKSFGYIDGSVTANTKAKVEDNFNSGKMRWVVGQIAAMGESLNLQYGGKHVVFAEPDWSPGAMDQAMRRLWRFGQTCPVHVHYCAADHPADDAAYRVLYSKANNIDSLYSA